MKTFLVTLLLTFSVASGTAYAAEVSTTSAVGEELLKKNSSVDWDFQDKISQEFDLSLPQMEGRTFTLLNLGFSSDFYLGCNGFGAGRIDKQMVGEMKALVKYVQRNALGLAINYLIYESPTLYSIYEHLQTLRQFNIDQSIMSCSQIRELATDRRRAKELGAAKDKCLQDGNSKEDCEDGNTLDRYFRGILGEQSQAQKEATGGKSDGTPTKTFISSIGDGPSERELAEWLEQVMPSRDNRSGTTIQKDAKAAVEENMQKLGERYYKLIDAVVRTPAAQRSKSPSLAKLVADTGNKAIPPATFLVLEKERLSRPARYLEDVALLARTMVMNNIRYKISQTKLLLTRSRVLFKDDALSDDDRIYLTDAVAYLEAQFNLFETRYANDKKLFAAEDAVTTR